MDLTVLPAVHTPRSSANGINRTCLCLPSRSWCSFADPWGMDGWVGLGWLVGYIPYLYTFTLLYPVYGRKCKCTGKGCEPPCWSSRPIIDDRPPTLCGRQTGVGTDYMCCLGALLDTRILVLQRAERDAQSKVYHMFDRRPNWQNSRRYFARPFRKF